MERKFTEEQLAVIEAVGQPGASLMIEAGAGCAKTTTLAAAAATVRVPALALAFAVQNKLALREALPANWEVKSFNGLGHGAWARSPQCRAAKLSAPDDRKTSKLVSQLARDHKIELGEAQWPQVRELVSRAMTAGIVPTGSGPEGLAPDDPAVWADLASEVGIDSGDIEMLAGLAREVLVQDIALARQGIISYDDQVYCPTLLGARFPAFPVTAVDEDQDLSPVQVKMLGLASRDRIIAVGDRRQAIYAWRGASGQAGELIRGLRPEWLELPLMTSFRVPQVIAKRQQRHCPGFRAAPGNPEGRLASLPAAAQDSEAPSWSWRDLQALTAPTGALAVICRNNAPLLKMAFRLLRRGVGCQMLGRDIGKGLVALSKKLAPDDAIPAARVRDLVTKWEAQEVSTLTANGHPERAEAVMDKSASLLAVLEGSQARDAGQLRAMLGRLFERTEGQVTLASIHRAKGLEWGTVLALDPWRGQADRAKASVAGEQERNLDYVRETRTRHTLVFGNSDEFGG